MKKQKQEKKPKSSASKYDRLMEQLKELEANKQKQNNPQLGDFNLPTKFH